MKKYFIIFFNTLLLIFFLEVFFKTKDFFNDNYFDNKKNIISFYSNYKSHPLFVYSARKNNSGKSIHYVPDEYFRTTTNGDGFRTHEFYPKYKDNFRILILGDSMVYGQNANDVDTIAVNLEKLYKKKISNKIEVLSLGVTGYSGLNYSGIARTYFDYLDPDVIIICVDQSDFNDDEFKINSYNYEYDNEGYPYFVNLDENKKSFTIDTNRVIAFVANNKNELIHKIKLESSLFHRINYLKHKLRRRNLDNEFEKYKKQEFKKLNYKLLSSSEKKNLFNLVDNGDVLKYDLEKSKKEYKITFNSLKYVSKKAESLNAKLYFSTHPYSWHINPEFSLYYQLKFFNQMLDFRENNVYPELVNHYAKLLDVENLNSFDHFRKLSGIKLWGDYDSHFNARGYEEYANFLFNKTENFITEKIKLNETIK
jgi:hypothetical protein|tara:strand:+ start:865 stop:2136 length:1272 start_codon:yes stop_codon:yes gene_type:complete